MSDDAELEQLAQSIWAGEDQIVVPGEMIIEPEEKVPPKIRESLQQQIQNMPTGERLKLAMKGNRETRVILMRDSSLMIRRFVLMNPRLTEDEVLMLVRNRQTDREVLEIVWRNDEWMNNYQIKLGMVKHPKVPVQVSMKYIGSLMMRDLRQMAKSKNIPTAINSAAKRIVVRGTHR